MNSQQRTRARLAVMAGAARWAERSGLTRYEAFAATLERGIDVQIQARRARRYVTGGKVARGEYWHAGGAGPGVVLVNGWTASGLVWPRALIERLEARCHVVRIDNRGTGTARGAPTPFTIATLAGDVRRAIASVGLERPTVVGFSMGGMISQELALHWPAVVGQLVLVGTRPPAPDATAPATGVFQALLAATPNGQTLETTIRQRWTAVTGPAFASTNGALVDEMVDTIVAARTPLAAVASQAQAAAAWHGARRLRHLAVPTTIVHGDADPLVPVRNGVRLAQLIPDASYIELPGVGHLVPYEACDRLASIIENVTLVR